MSEEVPVDVLFVCPRLEFAAATLRSLTLSAGLNASGLVTRFLSAGGSLEVVLRDLQMGLDLAPWLSVPLLGRISSRRFARRYRRRGIRIVHAQSVSAIGVGRRLARRFGAPLVCSVHRFLVPGVPTASWKGVDAVIVVGEALREDVINQRRAPRDRVHLVRAGIACSYEPVSPFAHGGVPVIGTVGDRDKVFAQEAFCRAAATVLKRAPEAQFLVVGEGGRRGDLRALTRDLGIHRNVTFTPVKDLRKILPVMDICVLPSAEDGPGPAVLEAMAAGRPVVAVGAGGAFTVVKDGVTGLLVERGDADALSRAVLLLVEDRERARDMGRAARAVAEKDFPLEDFIQDTLAVYRSVGWSG